jgi:hypothetical protein
MKTLITKLLEKFHSVALQQWERDHNKYSEIYEQTDADTHAILSLTFQTSFQPAINSLRRVDIFLTACLFALYLIFFGWGGGNIVLDALPAAFHWWQILLAPIVMAGAVFCTFYLLAISTFVSIPLFFLFRWLIAGFSSRIAYLHCLEALHKLSMGPQRKTRA